MASAFIETTVLTNLLLKRDGSERQAKAAINRFQAASVAQFAWKEFKRGPLQAYVWAFNKLVETGSFSEMVAALQRLSRTPKAYLTATAIQALHTFIKMLEGVPLSQLQRTYGNRADTGAMLSDAFRIEMKYLTFSAWRKRKTLFGGMTQRLSCYPDSDLHLEGDRIETSPRDCPKDASCCLKQKLVHRILEVSSVRAALRSATGAEQTRRKRVLKRIEKHPGVEMSPSECRAFGDAYFVLFCPKQATILTTNLRDIEPMARALGVHVQRP
jgi:hypothetical protein